MSPQQIFGAETKCCSMLQDKIVLLRLCVIQTNCTFVTSNTSVVLLYSTMYSVQNYLLAYCRSHFVGFVLFCRLVSRPAHKSPVTGCRRVRNLPLNSCLVNLQGTEPFACVHPSMTQYRRLNSLTNPSSCTTARILMHIDQVWRLVYPNGLFACSKNSDVSCSNSAWKPVTNYHVTVSSFK